MASSWIYKFFKSHSKMNFNKVLKSNLNQKVWFKNEIRLFWLPVLLMVGSVFILGFHYKIIFFCFILFKFFLLKNTEPPCLTSFWRPPEEQRLCWWCVLSVVCRYSVPVADDYINKSVTSWQVCDGSPKKRKKEAENRIQNFGSQALLLHITVIIWNF